MLIPFLKAAFAMTTLLCGWLTVQVMWRCARGKDRQCDLLADRLGCVACAMESDKGSGLKGRVCGASAFERVANGSMKDLTLEPFVDHRTEPIASDPN